MPTARRQLTNYFPGVLSLSISNALGVMTTAEAQVSRLGPATGPRNPFLADSGYPIAHGRCDAQDSSRLTGPTGPSEVLSADDLAYVWLGAGHFGSLISGTYPDGRRVIWSNGRQNIVKLDYESLQPLASYAIPGQEPVEIGEMKEALEGLDSLSGPELLEHVAQTASRFMTGLDGVYAVLDCNHTLFLGRKTHAVAYAEEDPTDPASPIVETARWEKPAEISGSFVGVNMTFDGHLVLTTDHGWVVCLERDFKDYKAIRLRHSEVADAWCAEQAERFGHTGYGWMRKSCCVDQENGIYIPSRDHLHKVVWTGSRLSIDETDGAWSARYRNGSGNGSGTTPSLMGFGDDDRFVVIGDGDRVVNITLFWRDEIPDDWEQLSEGPDRRIAGIGPADMGFAAITDLQTEQSITVSGYGAMTVNNDPVSMPEGVPRAARRHIAFFLGHRPEFTPRGLHKYEWDSAARQFRQAWINQEVASPNSVPFVSQGADLVYTCGVQDGKWTIEAVDWSTGERSFQYILGGSQFNTLGAGVTLDEEARLLFGTIFGKVRIER